MKKYFMFVAVAAAGMLASCSSESLTAGSDPKIEPTQEERVPIEINVATIQAKAVTRGSGSVGGVEDGNGNPLNDDGTDTPAPADNEWDNQIVNVFMFEKGSLTLAKELDGSDIYNNNALTTPTGTASGQAIEWLTPTTIQHRYYPQGGYNFDFWAYYADDANATAVATDPANAVDATAPIASEIVDGDQDVIVPFEIDGTQDLMVAKAVPSGADITALGDRGTDFYSAYAARKGVQPDLAFKHLLTRLTFSIQGGNAAACGWTESAGTWSVPVVGKNYQGVFIKSIKIKSQSTGYIVAAYTRGDMTGDTRYQDPTKLIKFDNTTTAPATDPDNYIQFTLMNYDNDTDGQLDPLYNWSPIAPADLVVTAPGADHYNALFKPTCSATDPTDLATFTYDKVHVGSAMLVQPRDSYIMDIELGQYLLDVEDTDPLTDADGDGDPDDNKYIIKDTPIRNLTVNIAGGFKAGKSYNVNIAVWGNEEIKIYTTLEPWIFGDNVNVATD